MNDIEKARVRRAASVLREAGAQDVFLFGSASKGSFREASDIDIAVSGLPPERFFDAMGLAGDILRRNVDLVDLDEDTPFIRHLKEHEELVRVD